ncbi:MAG: hypothetical protein AB1393_07925 [Candidatus Edwardsbacteria bacterium]
MNKFRKQFCAVLCSIIIAFVSLIYAEEEKLLNPLPDTTKGDTISTLTLEQSQISIAKKSIKKAFFLSLLVPGTGELYVGEKFWAKRFFLSEGVIWGTALVFNIQGKIKRDDYHLYVRQKAGVHSTREDDKYYENIYKYESSEECNEDYRRKAREEYPDNLEAQKDYLSDKLYGPEDAWQWTNPADWDFYRGLRVSSREAFQRVSYCVWVALLNRLISSVNAARLAKGHNKKTLQKSESLLPLKIELKVSRGKPGLIITGKF